MTAPPRRTWRITQSVLSYSVGVGGLIFEAVVGAFGRGADPGLVIVFGGLLGVPAMLAADAARKTAAAPPAPDPPPAPAPPAPVREPAP